MGCLEPNPGWNGAVPGACLAYHSLYCLYLGGNAVLFVVLFFVPRGGKNGLPGGASPSVGDLVLDTDATTQTEEDADGRDSGKLIDAARRSAMALSPYVFLAIVNYLEMYATGPGAVAHRWKTWWGVFHMSNTNSTGL